MFDKIKGYLLGVMLAVSLGSTGWFWYESNQLSHEITRISGEKSILEASVGILTDTNKRLAEQVGKSAASTEVTNAVNEALDKQREELDKQFEGLRKITQQKFADIEKKYAAMEDTPANKELRRVEIGMERSRGIWRMFCNSEPLAVECVK